MAWYRVPGVGNVHINMGSGKNARRAPKHCRERIGGATCGCIAVYECDWPGCDKPLCPEHACEVGENRHLCPEHRAQPGLDIGEGDDERQMTLV